jgi:hypothetical protein
VRRVGILACASRDGFSLEHEVIDFESERYECRRSLLKRLQLQSMLGWGWGLFVWVRLYCTSKRIRSRQCTCWDTPSRRGTFSAANVWR